MSSTTRSSRRATPVHGADAGLAGRPRIVAGLADPRDRAPVHPPGGGDRGRPSPARTSWSSRRPRRASRCATRSRPCRPSPRIRLPGRSSCSRPRRSARTRSTEFGELSRGGRAVDHRVDLRRRHAGADPVGDPGRRPGRRDQPGHAPLGDPAPPHEVVPAVRAAPLHRHRRAAHLPRRVRRPRRQRPAAAAPDLRPLRQPPGHRLLLGDHREPGRARGAADRAPGRGSSTATAPRPASATSCWSTRRSLDPPVGARGSAVTLAQRWALPFLRAGRQTIVFGRSRVAVEILLTGLRESLRESYGPRSRDPRLPRRLPADRAAADRARPARRRDPRRRRRRTRSSSASTSAAWTSRSWPAIRARSRRPGSSFGRAGRRQGTSVAVLVASGAPVDQYVIHHPEFLLEGTPEEARLDPDNLHVLLAHLRAATFELPFEPGEVFGPGPVDDLLAFLAEERPRPAGRRRPLVLVVGELPGVGDLAPDRGPGERRDHRHDAGPAAGPRRGRTCSAPRSSSTSRRSTSTSRSSTTSTGSSGASARPTSTGSTSTTTRTPTGR